MIWYSIRPLVRSLTFLLRWATVMLLPGQRESFAKAATRRRIGWSAARGVGEKEYRLGAPLAGSISPPSGARKALAAYAA